MHIENLSPKQAFVYCGRKFTAHTIHEFLDRVWVETTTGTLICERYGAFVEA